MRGVLNRRTRCAGFTLVELFMTVIVVGVLAAFVVPGMQNLIQEQRSNIVLQDVVSALTLARSEAIKRRQRVTVSALDGSDTSNEWGPGIRVWFDEDGDNSFDSNEEIFFQSGIGSSITIDVRDLDGTNLSLFHFNGGGRLLVDNVNTENPPLYMAVCDDSTTGELGKYFKATLTGKVATIQREQYPDPCS